MKSRITDELDPYRPVVPAIVNMLESTKKDWKDLLKDYSFDEGFSLNNQTSFTKQWVHKMVGYV